MQGPVDDLDWLLSEIGARQRGLVTRSSYSTLVIRSASASSSARSSRRSLTVSSVANPFGAGDRQALNSSNVALVQHASAMDLEARPTRDPVSGDDQMDRPSGIRVHGQSPQRRGDQAAERDGDRRRPGPWRFRVPPGSDYLAAPSSVPSSAIATAAGGLQFGHEDRVPTFGD